MYGLSLDELIEFDVDISEIQNMIEKTSRELTDKVNWTKVWSKQYPILAQYQSEVDIEHYADGLCVLLNELKVNYGYNELDAMLVLKDILGFVWKTRNKRKKKQTLVGK